MAGIPLSTWLGAGLGACVLVVMAIINGMGVVRYLRRTGDDAATALSLGGWVMSVVGLFLGPCALLTAVAALIIARLETGRVQREEASAWTLIPCQMMRINGLLTLFFVGIQIVAVALAFIPSA
jgi:hypothetical protein